MTGVRLEPLRRAAPAAQLAGRRHHSTTDLLMEDSIDLSRRDFSAPIPVVNLQLPEPELVAATTAACEHPGFFYLDGLPVRPALTPDCLISH